MNILGLGGLLIGISGLLNFILLQGQGEFSFFNIVIEVKYSTYFLAAGGIFILIGSLSFAQQSEKELKDEKSKVSDILETLRIRIKLLEDKKKDL